MKNLYRLYTILVSLFWFSISNAASLSVIEIIDFIENNNNNPFATLILEKYRNRVLEIEKYISGGNIIYMGRKNYAYSVSCRDRKYALVDFELQILGDTAFFDLSFDNLRNEIVARNFVNTDLYVHAWAEYKDKYKLFGSCQTAYSVSANAYFKTNIDLYVDFKAGFNIALSRYPYQNTIIITPYTKLEVSGNLNDPTTYGIDMEIPPELVLGLASITTSLISTLDPGLGLFAGASVLFGINDKLESIAAENIPELIDEFEAEINNGAYNKVEYKTPIYIGLPSGKFLTDGQYRKLMAKEGVGGFNCGPGKDFQSQALYALLSKDNKAYQTYIQPEVACRVLPAIISSLLL